MNSPELLSLGLAGLAAGGINAAVGSGTLITFPVLLALGVPPVSANATNTVGLVPGSIAGAWTYRARLAELRDRLPRWLIIVSIAAAAGALLVLVLPPGVFTAVVPWLILMAVGLVAVQPLLTAHLPERAGPVGATAWLGGTGFYGGYFGAGQGIAFMAALSACGVKQLHSANAAKNLLASAANATAAVVFALSGQVWWAGAAVMAACSLVGGYIGGHLTQRLPTAALRALVVVVGVVAAGVAFTK